MPLCEAEIPAGRLWARGTLGFPWWPCTRVPRGQACKNTAVGLPAGAPQGLACAGPGGEAEAGPLEEERDGSAQPGTSVAVLSWLAFDGLMGLWG